MPADLAVPTAGSAPRAANVRKRRRRRVAIEPGEWPAFLKAQQKADGVRARELARDGEEIEVLGQEEFLAAIQQLAPRVLAELAQIHRRIRRLRASGVPVRGYARMLSVALKKWAADHGLGAVDWALPLAHITLGLWRRDPMAMRGRAWALKRNPSTSERPISTRPAPAPASASAKRDFEGPARRLVLYQVLGKPMTEVATGKAQRGTLHSFAELIGVPLRDPEGRGPDKRKRRKHQTV